MFAVASFAKEMGHPRPLFRLFLAFFLRKQYKIYSKLM